MAEMNVSIDDLKVFGVFDRTYNLLKNQKSTTVTSRGNVKIFLQKVEIMFARIERVKPQRKWFFYDLERDVNPALKAWNDLTKKEQNLLPVRMAKQQLDQMHAAVTLAGDPDLKIRVLLQFTDEVRAKVTQIREIMKGLLQPPQ